jgi:ribosomal 30S subunit maturation factor RimM
VIENQDKDYLVPLAETIVVNIDIEKRVILIDPPEGLLEL